MRQICLTVFSISFFSLKLMTNSKKMFDFFLSLSAIHSLREIYRLMNILSSRKLAKQIMCVTFDDNSLHDDNS